MHAYLQDKINQNNPKFFEDYTETFQTGYTNRNIAEILTMYRTQPNLSGECRFLAKNNIVSFPIEKTDFSTTVHETIHSLSTQDDKVGYRKNNIFHPSNKDFSAFNEIVTQHLTLKLCHSSPNKSNYIIDYDNCSYNKTCFLMFEFLNKFENYFKRDYLLGENNLINTIGEENFKTLAEVTSRHLSFDNLELFDIIQQATGIKINSDREFMQQVDNILTNHNLHIVVAVKIKKYKQIIDDVSQTCNRLITLENEKQAEENQL